MDKIVAVGGTGQDVLQLYLLAYLAGMVERPFDALVIDADALHPGIDKIRSFLETTITDGKRHAAFGADIPRIEYQRAKPQGNSVAEVLLGRRPDADERTAAHAFFDEQNLIQAVDRGLFARPALSSILGAGLLNDRFLMPDQDGRVYLVGSVLGGTGGGLLARIVDATHDVAARHGRAAKIRAVLFGEYFEPSAGLIDRARMRSNQFMVLRALEEGARHIHSFSIVDAGEGRRIERATSVQIRVPVPEQEDHPLWRGVNALHWFRSDEVKDAQPEFKNREKELPTPPPLRLHAVRQRLARVKSACRTLADRSVPELVANEPWASTVWGRELTLFTRHALARVDAGASPRAAAAEISRRARDLWVGLPDREGIGALLPESQIRVTPADLRDVRWPDASVGGSDMDDAAARIAANFLFHCMRGMSA